jgi:putative alpha-1,2-mannosidase
VLIVDRRASNFTHKGFTGFPSPRLSSGEFNLTAYNPATCGVCSWPSVTYEGTPFGKHRQKRAVTSTDTMVEYAFTVPHDMETLIEFMGGPDEFERRLDYIFVANTSETTLGANGAGINTIMNIGQVLSTPLICL